MFKACTPRDSISAQKIAAKRICQMFQEHQAEAGINLGGTYLENNTSIGTYLCKLLCLFSKRMVCQKSLEVGMVDPVFGMYVWYALDERWKR